MALLDWATYSATHSAVTEDEFDKAEALAERDVSLVIGPIRWALVIDGTHPALEFFEDQLLECIARVMDYNVTESAQDIGKGIASASNDGYSETYNTELQTASAAAEEKRKNIRAWLSGTGLVGAY